MKLCSNEYKLFEYAEGDLTGEDSKEVELHLNDCKNCRNTVEEFAALKSGIYRFYDQVDLKKNGVVTSNENKIFVNRNNSLRYNLLLAAFFTISFLYILLSPSSSLVIEDSPLYVQSGNTIEIDDSRWNLDINLIENKIESIRAEIDDINNNKIVR